MRGRFSIMTATFLGGSGDVGILPTTSIIEAFSLPLLPSPTCVAESWASVVVLLDSVSSEVRVVFSTEIGMQNAGQTSTASDVVEDCLGDVGMYDDTAVYAD